MISLYYGPWIWDAAKLGGCWRGPIETMQALDLRNLPSQSTRGGSPGMGLFASTADKATVGSDYDLLGKGNWHDIKATPKMRAALSKHASTPVKGDDLVGLIWDMMTDGADPDGFDFGKPILPTCEGRIELHFGGQRHAERFKWGGANTNKIRQVLRKDFQALFDDVQSGKTRDRQIHRKVLDFLCEKYNVEDWKEFVPVALQKDIQGRLPHETTITDDFNRSDAASLGTASGGWSWTAVQSTQSIVSNVANIDASAFNSARAESDLSSADHYAQVSVVTLNANFNYIGGAVRFASAANTHYVCVVAKGEGDIELWKRVAGGFTVLSTAGITQSIPETYKTSINGSTLKGYQAGVERVSTTDTAITGNTRTGISGYQDYGTLRVDDFEAADLSAGGILYTQLERSTRGLNRGMYTGGV